LPLAFYGYFGKRHYFNLFKIILAGAFGLIKAKGIATIGLMVGAVIFCVISSWVSVKFLGPDNFLEEELEKIAQDEVHSMFPHKNKD